MGQSLQGNLTKKAHTKQKFTEQHILELNKCMDPKLLYDTTSYQRFYEIRHV